MRCPVALLALAACSRPAAGFHPAAAARRDRARILTRRDMYVAGAENGISPGAPARRSGEVTVRFINTPAGEDVTTTAELGEVLMQVGDRVGIAVPRGCRTGLCGACTCDIQDPTWKAAAALSAPGAPKRAGDLGPRDGWQTVRACSAEVALPAGCGNSSSTFSVWPPRGRGERRRRRRRGGSRRAVQRVRFVRWRLGRTTSRLQAEADPARGRSSPTAMPSRGARGTRSSERRSRVTPSRRYRGGNDAGFVVEHGTCAPCTP